jgi:hypothetical protein
LRHHRYVHQLVARCPRRRHSRVPASRAQRFSASVAQLPNSLWAKCVINSAFDEPVPAPCYRERTKHRSRQPFPVAVPLPPLGSFEIILEGTPIQVGARDSAARYWFLTVRSIPRFLCSCSAQRSRISGNEACRYSLQITTSEPPNLGGWEGAHRHVNRTKERDQATATFTTITPAANASPSP